MSRDDDRRESESRAADGSEHVVPDPCEWTGWDCKKHEPELPADDPRTVVTVVGGGVAGLSAAHELVERGFIVQVVEPAWSLDDDGAVEVGGMARTQYGQIRLPSDQDPTQVEDVPEMSWARPAVGFPEHILFERGECEWDGALSLDGILGRTGDQASAVGSSPTISNERKLEDVARRIRVEWLERVRIEQARVSGAEKAAQHREDWGALRTADSASTPPEEGNATEEGSTGDEGEKSIDRAASREQRRQAHQDSDRERRSACAFPAPPEGRPAPAPCAVDPKLVIRIVGHTDAEPTTHLKCDDDEPPTSGGAIADEPKVASGAALTDDPGCDEVGCGACKDPAARADPYRLTCGRAEHVREQLKALLIRLSVDEPLEDPVDRALLEDYPPVRDRSFDEKPGIGDEADTGATRNTGVVFQIYGAGANDPIGDERNRVGRTINNRVEIELQEVRAPGEHGYRFFPRFYRHLDDVMKRTPVFDDDGRPTRNNTLEQLEPAEVTAFALEDDASPYQLTRRRFRSVDETLRTLREFQERLDFPDKDAARYALKVFKFATASSARRASEYEDVSWWDFVEGGRYSESVQHHIDNAPKALVATSTKESDARTNGNILVQLMLDQLADGTDVDRILRGPTSEAWLRHWKTYLKKQGVRFFAGRLDRVAHQWTSMLSTWSGEVEELVPHFVGTRHGKDYAPVAEDGQTHYGCGHVPPIPEPIYPEGVDARGSLTPRWIDGAHFYVLALSARQAQDVLQNSPQIWYEHLDPSLRALYDYDVGSRKPDGSHGGTHRDFFGLQFYFRHDFKYAPGHTYLVDSDWGLSMVSQNQYWPQRRARPSLFMGVLSVDIGIAHSRDSSVAKTHVRYARSVLEQARDLLREERDVRLPREQLDLALSATERAMDSLVEVAQAGPMFSRIIDDASLRWAIWDADDLELLIDMADLEDLHGSVLDLEDWLNYFEFPVLRTPTSLPQRRAAACIKDAAHALISVADAMMELVVEVDQRRHGQLFYDRIEILWRMAAVCHSALYAVKSSYEATSAWRSTREQMAWGAWDQIKLGLADGFAADLPYPDFFAIDSGIRFGHDGLPFENRSLYHIAAVDGFRHRPGPIPVRIREDGRPEESGPAEDEQSRDFYELAHGRWALAGSYTKTYTRLATMEHSNEAARHAVNAVLNRLRRGARPYEYYAYSARRGGAPRRLQGDYCRIWDPEEREFDEFNFLKRIDERLVKEGLPHFVEILGLEEALERWVPRDDGLGALDHVLELLRELSLDPDFDFLTRIPNDLLGRGRDQLERLLDRALEKLMHLGA